MRKIAVFGAGTMGQGIGQVLRQAGFGVVFFDRFGSIPGLRKRAEERIWTGLFFAKDLEGKPLFKSNAELREACKDIEWYDATEENLGHLAECKAAIEAVPEDIQMKAALYKLIEKYGNAEGRSSPIKIFTNTSTLRVNLLAETLARPENFMGLHFFNPVPMINFVEMIPNLRTSYETRQLAEEILAKMHKDFCLVGDAPGFVVNRILIPMIVALTDEVAAGASAEEIDQAFITGTWGEHPAARRVVEYLIARAEILMIESQMAGNSEDEKYIDDILKTGAKFPTGPFGLKKALRDGATKKIKFRMGPARVADLVGIDVVMHCSKMLAMQEPTLWKVPPLIEAMVAAGKLGEKSGQGFYTYGDPVTVERNSEKNYAKVSWDGRYLSSTIVRKLTETLATLRGEKVSAVILEFTRVRGANVWEFPLAFRDPATAEDMVRSGQKLVRAIHDFPVPVVAIVRGSAWGGGYELALACDYIIAEEGATVGLPEMTLGILPGWGGTQSLARRVGVAPALSMILRGETLKVTKPWVDKVVPKILYDRLEELIASDKLLKRSREPIPYTGETYSAIVEAIGAGMDEWTKKGVPPASFRLAEWAVVKGNIKDFEASLADEYDAIIKAFETRDAEEGIRAAILERRDPKFCGA